MFVFIFKMSLLEKLLQVLVELVLKRQEGTKTIALHRSMNIVKKPTGVNDLERRMQLHCLCIRNENKYVGKRPTMALYKHCKPLFVARVTWKQTLQMQNRSKVSAEKH